MSEMTEEKNWYRVIWEFEEESDADAMSIFEDIVSDPSIMGPNFLLEKVDPVHHIWVNMREILAGGLDLDKGKNVNSE
jgi:hypothetical protein